MSEKYSEIFDELSQNMLIYAQNMYVLASKDIGTCIETELGCIYLIA